MLSVPSLIETNSASTNNAQVKIEEDKGGKGKTLRRRRFKPAETVEKHLLRKISKSISNYYNITGKHIAVVVQIETRTNRPGLRIFGSKQLVEVIRGESGKITTVLDGSACVSNPGSPDEKEMFELPPLVVDGIPQPLSQMSQLNLRAFIPLMLKYSTGRGKPGWGKEQLKPPWWPEDTPWMNVRLDCRSDEVKLRVSWTSALRKIIRNCYYYHGREDLLRESDDLHKSINEVRPDFITYRQSWRYCRETKKKESTFREKTESEQRECEKNEEDTQKGSDAIIIESNQPCYIYNVLQNHSPIYTIPVQSGAVNVVNVFTTESLKSFANNVANHFAGKSLLDSPQISVKEFGDETIEEKKQSNLILENPNAKSSYGALEIDAALLLNDQQSTEDQFTLQHANEAEYIFLDDVTGKIGQVIEENGQRKVVIIDPINPVDIQVEDQKMPMQP